MSNDVKTKKLEIVCKENGPYIVHKLGRMTNIRGEVETTKAVMALCRCGQPDLKTPGDNRLPLF